MRSPENVDPNSVRRNLAARTIRPQSVWPYVQITRIDHWFKNAFMLLGVGLACFYKPHLLTWASVPEIGIALIATCLIASSNYVINELLDAPHDRFHPTKRHRPAALGLVRPKLVLAEWLVLGAAGVALAGLLNFHVMASALLFWLMGVLYNVRPMRTKELTYLDVLSEAVNNPIRLFLGWFTLMPGIFPPISLIFAYWMAGAFFMATKRYAEYRHIMDGAIAAGYRRSFKYYSENSLLVSMLFYSTTSAFFAGVFLVRYHLELLLFMPIAAGFFAYYLKLALQPNSPVQNPEKLYKERGFVIYAAASSTVFALLMFTHIPRLYDIFHVEPAEITALWTLGSKTSR